MDVRETTAAEPHNPSKGMDHIAVIVPVYMGRAVLHELCSRLVRTLGTITDRFSIVLVDDRSPDDVWPVIQELGRADRRIKGIQLSRNFGQHHALTAGIDYARARWYVVMDCDLQDAPEDLPLLYNEVVTGFDMVVGVRQKEGHGRLKRYTSRFFYALFNRMAGISLDWGTGNYRIFSHRVADGFRQMREQMRFFPASLSFMGFEVGTVALPHHQRAEGSSSYTFRKLASLAANTILAHSEKPLRIAIYLGFTMATLSMIAAGAILLRALIWGVTVTGWTSLIVSVFLVGGVQILVAGIVGIYVGKCFEETKRRPLYFVRDTCNI
jgi:glycosyltransferase involved in cell wall biosynthesis